MRTDWPARARAKAQRAARLALFGALVGGAVSLLAARHVRAEVVSGARESAAALAVVADLPDLGGGLTRLSLNGAHVDVAAAVVPRSLAEVVADVEKSCRAGVEGLELAPPRATGAQRFDLATTLFAAARSVTTRTQDGVNVLCLAETEHTRGTPIGERLVQLGRTRDLAAVGSLRHFTLTPIVTPGAGGSPATRVLAAWLPAQFVVNRVFPETGDAPGSDVEGAPRPEGARRLLTAGAEGHANLVRVYEIAAGSGDRGEVERRYGEALARAGWRPLAEVPEHLPAGATVLALGARDLMVQVRGEAPSGRVFVSTIEMRAPRAEP